MDKEPTIWALGWRPGSFLFISLFLAGDLVVDVARETTNVRHVALDIVSLAVALFAFVGSAWQSWRALRCAREAAARPGEVPGSSGG